MGIINRISNAKIKFNQRTTSRTNKRTLKLKAQRIRLENKSKAIKSYNSETKRISKAKQTKKISRFGQAASNLRKKNTSKIKNSGTSQPYWMKSNSSSSNTPYWMKSETKAKPKKKRGKTIIIRL